MSKLKHNKYRNTAFIFEILSRKITSEILNGQEPKATKIISKFFSRGILARELALYNLLQQPKNKLTESKTIPYMNEILKYRRKMDNSELNKIKYRLIGEIKKMYDIDELFSTPVENYKKLATISILFENEDSPKLLEYRYSLSDILMESKKPTSLTTDEIEWRKYDSDLRLLTYKMLIEKFNVKYGSLLKEQRDLLKQYIEQENIRQYVQDISSKLQKELKTLSVAQEDAVKIKLSEVSKLLDGIKNTRVVRDNQISALLNYYQLIHELKK